MAATETGTGTENMRTEGIAMSVVNVLIATEATGIGRDLILETTEDDHARGLGTGTGKATITEDGKTADICIHATGIQTIIIGAKHSKFLCSIFITGC